MLLSFSHFFIHLLAYIQTDFFYSFKIFFTSETHILRPDNKISNILFHVKPFKKRKKNKIFNDFCFYTLYSASFYHVAQIETNNNILLFELSRLNKPPLQFSLCQGDISVGKRIVVNILRKSSQLSTRLYNNKHLAKFQLCFKANLIHSLPKINIIFFSFISVFFLFFTKLSFIQLFIILYI